MKNLPDLTLDTPEADNVLGNFLARAVADDCVPPKFLETLKEKADTDNAKFVVVYLDLFYKKYNAAFCVLHLSFSH